VVLAVVTIRTGNKLGSHTSICVHNPHLPRIGSWEPSVLSAGAVHLCGVWKAAATRPRDPLAASRYCTLKPPSPAAGNRHSTTHFHPAEQHIGETAALRCDMFCIRLLGLSVRDGSAAPPACAAMFHALQNPTGRQPPRVRWVSGPKIVSSIKNATGQPGALVPPSRSTTVRRS
jgi:hypothetical protein